MRVPVALLALSALFAAPAAHAQSAVETAQRQLDREMARDLTSGDRRDPRVGPAVAGTAGAAARTEALESDRVPLLTLRGMQDEVGTSGLAAPAPALGGNLTP